MERPLNKKPRHRRIVLKIQPHRTATREHLVRRCEGGGNGDNLTLACRFCNNGRDDRTVEQHKAHILKLIEAGQHPNMPRMSAYHTRANKYQHLFNDVAPLQYLEAAE